MAFFNRMQATANRLNRKYGNGSIALVRTTPGKPDPAQPWEPAAGTEQREALFGHVTGIPAKWVDGETILASDSVFEGAVPAMTPLPGDRIEADGRLMTVVSVRPEFAAGLPVMMRLVVRG